MVLNSLHVIIKRGALIASTDWHIALSRIMRYLKLVITFEEYKSAVVNEHKLVSGAREDEDQFSDFRGVVFKRNFRFTEMYSLD